MSFRQQGIPQTRLVISPKRSDMEPWPLKRLIMAGCSMFLAISVASGCGIGTKSMPVAVSGRRPTSPSAGIYFVAGPCKGLKGFLPYKSVPYSNTEVVAVFPRHWGTLTSGYAFRVMTMYNGCTNAGTTKRLSNGTTVDIFKLFANVNATQIAYLVGQLSRSGAYARVYTTTSTPT